MTRAAAKLRVLVAGRFADVAEQGGATWAILQYVHGLARLGHDVRLVEPAPASGAVAGYFHRVVAGQALAGRAALVYDRDRTSGIPYPELREWAAHADLLLNLGGVLQDPELTGPIPVRAFVDLDPGFTQWWQAAGTGGPFEDHHCFASVGQAIGREACTVPALGRNWIPTLPPVVLDEWPADSRATTYGLTTVGNWRSYGPVTVDGVHYGQRVHSMRRLIEVPERVPGAVFEPALAIHRGEVEDLAALAAHGWQLVDPRRVARGPGRYRQFVRASTAEFGVAKEGYVRSRCAWFSDRSACYLASGRPVVAQDTGWPAFVPEGEGLLAFSDVDSAAAAVAEVLGNYRRHAKAARRLAEELFDARRVLTGLLDAIDGAAP